MPPKGRRTVANFSCEFLFQTPVPVAERSKAWICRCPLAAIAGLNSVGGHGYLFLVSVMYCQVEASATGRSPVQRGPHRLWCVVVCGPETSRMKGH